MDNKEMEIKKLDTEELEPIAGGEDLDAELKYYNYLDFLKRKYKFSIGPDGDLSKVRLGAAEKAKLEEYLRIAKIHRRNLDNILAQMDAENPQPD